MTDKKTSARFSHQPVPGTPYEEYKALGFDQFCALHEDLYCGLDLLRAPKDQQNFQCHIQRASLDTLSFNQEYYSAEFAFNPTDESEFYAINIPLTGRLVIENNEGRALLSPGKASIGTPYRVKKLHYFMNHVSQLVLKIDRNSLDHHLAKLTGFSTRKAIKFKLELDLSTPAMINWYQSVQQILAEMKRQDSVYHSEQGKLAVEEMLVTSFLLAHPNSYSDALHDRLHKIAPAHVKRAEEFMHANLQQPISLQDITAAVGISIGTLTSSFKKFRGTTPIAYLRELRLAQAHQEILRAVKNGENTEVIARRWGFSNHSRFNKLYAIRFGYMPNNSL